MNTPPTPPPAAPATTAMVIEQLREIRRTFEYRSNSFDGEIAKLNRKDALATADAITHLTALSERCASLEEDGKRLDWLEKFLRMGGTCVSCDSTGEVKDTDFVHGPGDAIECYSGHYSVGYQVETEHRGCYRWEELGNEENRLRAAIDAARPSKEGG